jgi:hypothetical protein
MVAVRRGASVKALKESDSTSKSATTDKVIHQCEDGRIR